jgi:ABC-type uncharacterized transport system permease subunit
VKRVLHAAAGPALAILTAIVAGGLVIIFTDPDTLGAWRDLFHDPLAAFDASWDVVFESYHALFTSSLGSQQAIGRTLVEAAPLLFAGLSVTLAFRAGLFNIGGAGQLLVGAAAAATVGLHVDLPRALHLPLALAAGAAGGALWGGLAGFLKARTGAHEVITTIMLNFIAFRLVDYLLSTDPFLREGRNDPITPPMPESARLPTTGGELDVHLGLVLAVLAAVGVAWLLQRTTVGFRMRAVGANHDAAAYAGMAVASTYVLSMAIAGGLAGLAGTTNLLGRPSYSLIGGFYAEIGFDAIALALLARANPYGVIGSSFLFGALRAGARGMQAATGTPVDIIVVIQALIILFVAAPSLIRAIYRIRSDRLTTGQGFSTNWGA